MQWIWPDSYFEPTESAWLVAHKFAYLNFLSGERLGKVLRGGHTKGSTPKRLSELIASERENGRRPDASADVLRAYTRAEAFGGHVGKATAAHVRYCRSCLQQWYHATAFQYLALRSCPLHAEELCEGCWNCRTRWTVDFVASEYKEPLHCHNCGVPLAGTPPRFGSIFPRAHPAWAAIAGIDRRLRDVCASTSVHADLPEQDIALDLYASVLCAGTCWPECLDLRRIALIRLHENHRPPRYELQDFRDAARQIRSIGRHLARLFPECRGHPAVAHRWEEWGEGWNGPKAVSLLVPANGCVPCWALTLWRWQFMPIFGVVREPLHFEAFFRRDRVLVNESLGFDLADAGPLALASFGWCALTVASLAGTLSNPEARECLPGGGGREGLLVWQAGPLPRCVYRHPRDGPIETCCIATADIVTALSPVAPWSTSERISPRPSTLWGETVFNAMYRPKAYVDESYAWARGDGAVESH